VKRPSGDYTAIARTCGEATTRTVLGSGSASTERLMAMIHAEHRVGVGVEPRMKASAEGAALTCPPPVELERTQERHQVLLLLRIEFDAEDQVEELHGVVERQQAIVVQVRRRVLDAAQREGLDRAIG